MQGRRPLNLLLFGLLVSLFVLAPVVRALEEVEQVAVDPDVGKSTVELIEARGYVAETHTVTTTDRYVLTLHRLPKSYAESQSSAVQTATAKPVVLLQHGLIDSSFAWVCNFRNQSLAFLLADAGYDVWLGNNRGNTYSTGHLDYTTDDDAYWDFSWEDMGKYDLPAMLDYVLATSGQATVGLVAHSEGSTQAFVGFSKNQTLAQSVSYFAALAPVAWLGHTTASALKLLASVYLDKWFELFGQVEFLSQNALLQEVIEATACTLNAELCETALALLSGNSANWNSSRVSVYLSEMPAGTSVKNMGHYAQGIRADTFASYDYGCSCLRLLGLSLCSTHICENKLQYGSFDPPAFAVSDMVYPRTGFFRGENDILATATDVEQIRSALPTATLVHDAEVLGFSHLDFTWAVNANEKVYQDVLAQLNEYTGVGY
ncbi:hypothetical protein BBJ28_00009558 [Nothophytophthora sp. Chile5]|nr:hypothetical protein BBJ28_00009558 [Nothophytophthora sp. Chile5]